MKLPRRIGGVAGHDEEVCGGGGQREGERERGAEVEHAREEAEVTWLKTGVDSV